MIEDFVRVFRKNNKEFENYDAKEKMEILFKIMEDEKLLVSAIEEIKSDELDNSGGNIFINLISLMPFSLKIVEAFLQRGFLDDDNIYKKLKIVFKTNSKIIDILQNFKKNMRNKNYTSLELDEKLKEVENELKKYEENIKKLEELERKKRELANKIGSEKRLEEIQKELKKLEESFKMYKSLEDEIKKSKKIFKNILEDES